MPDLTHRYVPRGAAKQLRYERRREVLLAGPAGTGKSRACLEKLFLAALKYPRMRGLIVRKTQSSLARSAMVTWKQKVLPEAIEAKQVRYYGGSGSEPQQFQFTNGSVILLAGMDQHTKIMSTEFDMIYVCEAVELLETDWLALITRLRNGVMPYQQIIADCNPDAPTHWLKQRSDNGITLMLNSNHTDNPVYYTEDGQLTDQGKPYIEGLQSMTGLMFERLYKGVWAGAEGLVYDGIETIEPFTIPDEWERYWSIDFGSTKPFVCQFWAKNGDGVLFLYREIYMTSRISSEHATQIQGIVAPNGVWLEPRPRAIITDHDANARGEMQKVLGLETKPAYKSVMEGIQAVQKRLKPDINGKPRLFIFKDPEDSSAFNHYGLVEKDPKLVAAHQPTRTAEEVLRYVWNPQKDAPFKDFDHGMDAMRYVVAEVDLGTTPGVRWLG